VLQRLPDNALLLAAPGTTGPGLQAVECHPAIETMPGVSTMPVATAARTPWPEAVSALPTAPNLQLPPRQYQPLRPQPSRLDAVPMDPALRSGFPRPWRLAQLSAAWHSIRQCARDTTRWVPSRR